MDARVKPAHDESEFVGAPAIASGAMIRNAATAPAHSTIAPPISAGSSPAAIEAASAGFWPAWNLVGRCLIVT
jgi:hypothetical protein